MWFNRSKDDRHNTTDQTTATRGAQAEAQAESYLIQQGLVTRAKNYRAKQGEIDLIMTHDDTLVFVEVRLRTNPYFSSAAETVDYRKQQKMIRTAQQFLLQQRLTDKVPCRFDVIAINNTPKDPNSIEWIKNAFSA